MSLCSMKGPFTVSERTAKTEITFGGVKQTKAQIYFKLLKI